MNLIADIGNTVIKIAVADGRILGKTWRYQGENWCEFLKETIKETTPERIVLCSARKLSQEFIDSVKSMCSGLIVMDPAHSEVNVSNDIPEYITSDSAASIIASRSLFKGKKCCIFDFGTMIKYTLLSEDGKYEGGNISPGCTTRFRSISRYAKDLPLLSENSETRLMGNSLESSVRSGVVCGIMFEIEGYMHSYPDDICIFTGGDAIYFAKRTKNSIFVVCNLVLMGLAIIADEYGTEN